MNKVRNTWDSVQQSLNWPKPWRTCGFYECVSLLNSEELRMGHLTSNWFHQTWKLHCYLVFCLSGSIQPPQNIH